MTECSSQWKELWAGNHAILANEQVGADTWKIALDAPELAERAKPGQFLMLRLPECADPLLGRPFGIFNADVATGRVEAVYAVVGKGTRRLAALKPGDRLELWGPLGNGWNAALRAEATAPKRLALVAGGVGCVPFYLLMKELASGARYAGTKATFVYGARNAERLCCVDEFRALGLDAALITEDGSVGKRGFVTAALPEILPKETAPEDVQILACGPTPMLRAVANWSAGRGYECWTSLESPMACGMGLCFSCVVDWRADDGTWDYKRACVDGPVFDAARLKWD